MSSMLPQVWDIIEQTSDRFKIQATTKAIDTAFEDEQTGRAIGHCKELLDSIFKTILVENSIEIPPKATTTDLAKKAFPKLHVARGVEKEAKAKTAFMRLVKSVAQTTENALTGISELRNDFCPAAHGKPNNHIPLDMHYARFIAGYVDNTVSFLYQLLSNTNDYVETISYHANPDLNNKIDEDNDPYEAIGELYRASEIIHHFNPKQYIALKEQYGFKD